MYRSLSANIINAGRDRGVVKGLKREAMKYPSWKVNELTRKQ